MSSGPICLPHPLDSGERFEADIANLSTYIIPRSTLPELPKKLKKELGFYYTYDR